VSWLFRQRASAILYDYLSGLGSEEEFLIPANSCPIVPATFLKARVPFQLVDIDPNSLCIDVSKVKAIITETPQNFGLLFIRPLGFIDDRSSQFAELKLLHPQLKIIDDRCLAPPTFDTYSFCSDAQLTLFSTGYSKVVEHGTGGYAFLRGTPPAQTCGAFLERHHNTLVSEFKKCIDAKRRLAYEDSDWLDLSQPDMEFDQYRQITLEKLRTAMAHKAKMNTVYKEQLGPNPKLQLLSDDYNNWRFNILTEDRKSILDAIFSNGFFASSHYASLAGIFDDSNAPSAGSLDTKIVNLFNDHRITEESAVQICRLVNKATGYSQHSELKL